MIGHPLSVRELLNEIARGEVMLPEIQRAYVWNGPQVAKLIDSIYNEFPTGQILLWDTQLAPIVNRRAAPLNRYFHDSVTWDEDAIRRRGEQLFETARRTWPRPGS